MKKLTWILASTVFAVMILSWNVSQAQWAFNGTHIYNTNTGNIGIGTGTSWAPTEKFHINNGTNTASMMFESSYSGTSGMKALGYIRMKNTASGDMFNMVLRKNGTVHEMLQSCYDATNSLWREFIYYNYTTRKYEMRNGVADAEFKNSGNILFTNTGNVGIGVAVPDQKLTVNGNIKCKQVEVTLTGWSDFVFESDYNLMPIAELEAFIKENKHLPDVPSANEVLSNGTNLGEMDAILLQKIEELTLYVIELKKENEAMKALIGK